MVKKELKPPPFESEDGTAPESYNVGHEFGNNVPRTIRNRLVHEHPQKLSHKDDEDEGEHLTKEELKAHKREVQAMHDATRMHEHGQAGVGSQGRGDTAVHSQVNVMGAPDSKIRHGHD